MLLFSIVGLQYSVNAQENKEIFTIYLVRHSEKEAAAKNPRNPALSQCGEQRAESLSKFLKDVGLDAIYSSNYIRTKSTAEPTSLKKKIETQMYNPRKLSDFASLLIERKQDALVVGHSNTTGVLAGLLVGKDIKPFKEDIYDRIYQIVIHKNTGRLQVFHSAFVCNN